MPLDNRSVDGTVGEAPPVYNPVEFDPSPASLCRSNFTATLGAILPPKPPRTGGPYPRPPPPGPTACSPSDCRTKVNPSPSPRLILKSKSLVNLFTGTGVEKYA